MQITFHGGVITLHAECLQTNFYLIVIFLALKLLSLQSMHAFNK